MSAEGLDRGMASFGDNILRLFKKMAKQEDQQANADPVSPWDGSKEDRLKQLNERTAQAADVSVQDSEFLNEEQMPARGKEFLQGNLGATGASRDPHKKSTLERMNIIYDKQESDSVKESLRVVSFNKIISYRGLDELGPTSAGSGEIIDSEFDEPGTASEFAGKLLGDQNKQIKAETWAASPGDALAPGKMVNPTEESFKQVATCATTSPSTLAWLASQPSAEIRAAVASNHHVPQDTLRKLAVDAEISVRLAVASNKRCADDILKQLTHDENRLVSGEAFSALALREKANAQASGPAFNRFMPPKVNPVQTKVPVIGGGSGTPLKSNAPAPLLGKPALPAPSFAKSGSLPSPLAAPFPIANAAQAPAPIQVQAVAPASTLSSPPASAPAPNLSSAPTPTLSPSPTLSSAPSPSPSPTPVPAPTPAPVAAANPTSAPVVSASPSLLPPRAVTPKALPKSTVTAMPPVSIPSPSANPIAKFEAAAIKSPLQPKAPAPMLPPAAVAKPATPVEHLVESEVKKTAPTPIAAPVKFELPSIKTVEENLPIAGPDGHNLLSDHKFKTTSNHLVASYTDLDAISLEMDNRSPNTWLSLNSEGAIKAYKKQKDTVKDVKMNLSAHNPNGPKRNSPIVNITPNATASETIAFLKLVAGRISTPPGRLKELAEHNNEEVRAAVAENVNLPSEAFLQI